MRRAASKYKEWNDLRHSDRYLITSAPAGSAVGCGDKIILPSDLLATLGDAAFQSDTPLLLRISARATKGGPVCYGTVLEFSAEAGTVVLPEWMVKHLGLSSHARALVEVLEGPLPKAEFCSMRPKSPEFFQFKDFRAVLESALGTRYTTLTQGTTIGIDHLGERWEVDVVTLEPDDVPACSILNTDVVVDLQPPLGPDGLPCVIPKGSEAAGKLPRQSSTSTLVTSVAPELGGGAVEFTLPMDVRDYRYLAPFRIPAGTPCTVALHCVSSDHPQADIEVYLGEGSGKPTLEQHYLTCNRGEYVRSAVIAVPARDTPHEYRLGVRSYAAPGVSVSGACVVAVRITPDQGGDGASDAGAAAPEVQDGKVTCPNCGKTVPAARAALHEAYCSRNNVKCNVCNRTLRKMDQATHWHCDTCTDPPFLANTEAGRAKHMALFHTDIPCGCGAVSLPLLQLQAHAREECPARRITCRFCFNDMAAGAPADDPADRYRGYTEHESRCGSKTSQCHKCSVHVRRRDLEAHAKLHMMDPQESAKGATTAASYRPPTDAERAAAWSRAGFGPPPGSSDNQGNAHAMATDPPAAAATPTAYPPGFLDPVQPTAAPTPGPLCQNHACVRAAAVPRNSLGACKACWSRLPPPADATPQALVKSLVKAYFQQVSKGCGDDGCANPQCAIGSPTGPVVGNAGAALSVKLAQAALSGRLELCLGPEGRAFAASVTALGAMGFPEDWASLAMDRTGSEQDAAIWLLSNYSPPEDRS
eukprot:m.12259 g.12259  ORF g.12259 m.12259 type:complete len:759 (-) comp2925_c0_seq1:98-2374(-)